LPPRIQAMLATVAKAAAGIRQNAAARRFENK
jgi:hypothetical protein